METRQCPVDHRQTPTLEPLTPVSSRRDVHRRLVAPLANSITVRSIDNLRDHPTSDLARTADLIESGIRLTSTQDERRIYQRTADLYTTPLMVDAIKPLLRQTPVNHYGTGGAPYVLPRQDNALTGNVMYPDPIDGFMTEALDTQVYATFNIMLPGYLIAQNNLSTPLEVANYMRSAGPQQISETLQEPEFHKTQRRLAITANGLYERSLGMYVDMPDKYPVMDVKNAISTHSTGRAIVAANPQDVPDSVNVHELYAADADDSISLSTPAIDALKYYLRFRNTELRDTDTLGSVGGPSAGCPVATETTRMHQDDLSDQQWSDLLDGKNPIATYNHKTQRLTYRRSAMKELNQFIADILGGKFA